MAPDTNDASQSTTITSTWPGPSYSEGFGVPAPSEFAHLFPKSHGFQGHGFRRVAARSMLVARLGRSLPKRMRPFHPAYVRSLSLPSIVGMGTLSLLAMVVSSANERGPTSAPPAAVAPARAAVRRTTVWKGGTALGLSAHSLAPPFLPAGSERFVRSDGSAEAHFSSAGMELSADGTPILSWAPRQRPFGAPKGSGDGAYSMRSFLGGEPSRWGQETVAYSGLTYAGSSPGESMEVRTRARGVEYSFSFPPGKGIRRVELEYRGATLVRRGAGGGALTIEAGSWHVEESGLKCFQPSPKGRLSVPCQYTDPVESPAGRWTYGIETGELDPSLPVVIDPDIDWVAGVGSDYWAVVAFAVDGTGASYAYGWYLSGQVIDTFLTKLKPDGKVDWTVMYGGSGYDFARAIALDKDGNILLSGQTLSLDFPMLQAFDTTGDATGDAFVMKVDSAGAILWSSYFGGSGTDNPSFATVDSSGGLVLLGTTDSADFPADAGFRPTSTGGLEGFVARIDPLSPPSLQWASYLGETSGDSPASAAEDPQGNIVITGTTTSDGQATPGAYATSRAGLVDTFAMKVNPSLPSLVWFTYLGGTAEDYGKSLAIDKAGSIYLAGWTKSMDWPVKQAFGPRLRGPTDGFLVKLAASGSSLDWSTYLGGGGGDGLYAVAVNADGTVCTGGVTGSADFPILNGFDTHFEVNPQGLTSDAILAVFDNRGTLLWSTFYGGLGNEWIFGLTTDPMRNIYALGGGEASVIMKLSYPDLTAPDAGVVNDGPGEDIDYQSSTSAVSANWSGFFDWESGVKSYEWAVGTAPGRTDLSDFADAGPDLYGSATGLSLAPGSTFYVTVRGLNDAGLGSVASSDGVTVDVTPPLVGMISDGDQATDIDVQASTSSLFASWAGFRDPESGISNYEWSIGTAPFATDVRGYSSAGLQLSAAEAGLALLSGKTYFVNVRATNRAGLSSTGHSDGVRVDIAFVGPGEGTDASLAGPGDSPADDSLGVRASKGGCGCGAGQSGAPALWVLTLFVAMRALRRVRRGVP